MLEESEYEVDKETNESQDSRQDDCNDRYDQPQSKPEELDENGEPIPHWKQEYINRGRAVINRLNALKSTGPKTPFGKRIVSRNALKHGLSSKRIIVEGESASDFKKFQRRMLADLAPVGDMEEMLADRITALTWRLKRAELMESAVLNVFHGQNSVQKQARTDFTPRELPVQIHTMIFDAMNADNPDNFLRAANMMIEYYQMKDDQKPPLDKILGSVAIQDFGDSGVIEKLMRYQKQMESSLYKAISELQRMQLLRKSKNSNCGPKE